MKNNYKIFNIGLLLLLGVLLQACGDDQNRSSTAVKPEASLLGNNNSKMEDVESTQPVLQPKTITKGKLSLGDISEDINQGEIHLYTYTFDNKHSNAYEWVFISVTSNSGTFDPYLIVKMNNKTIAENDNALFDEDYPTAARTPSKGGFCLSPNSPDTTLQIFVKDATGIGNGIYTLRLFKETFKLTTDKCSVVIP
jgi:hypothetical protein